MLAAEQELYHRVGIRNFHVFHKCRAKPMTGKGERKVFSYLGFARVLVYGLLGARGYWRTAACAGLVIMLAIVASEIRTPKDQDNRLHFARVFPPCDCRARYRG